jgi:outer membrane protein assembly factor BamB
MSTALRVARRSGRVAALAAFAAGSLTLSACGSGAGDTARQDGPAVSAPARATVAEPIVLTYDGGLYVLDGATLQVAADLPLPGFNRVNPAGDDRHVMVSTASSFRVLDAAGATLTETSFPAEKPGHVVRHADRTVLFADGTGEVTIFDPGALGEGTPKTETHRTPQPHHGVAVRLANGELVTTVGNAETRSGIVVLSADRTEIARNEDCPGVHGEAAAKGEAVVVGCETGVLVYKGGTITKIVSPTPYGRIGNQAGSDVSPITLGDYKQDKDAELERPTQISLTDTETNSLKLVDIGTSYSFRSLARGAQGEGLVLGTDGRIHVIDPVAGAVSRTIPVLDAWQEPLEWQQPRPALFVRQGTAYVTDPGKKQIHAIDIATGSKKVTGSVPRTPNELSGVTA